VTTLSPRPQSEFIPKVGAGCLVVLGLFMAVSALAALTVPPVPSIAGLVIMATIGAGFVSAGAYWWRFVRGSELRRRVEYDEKAVLSVASRHGGVVTVAQLALETELSAEEARAAVERLCIRGIAQPDVQDDGTMQYRFGGFLGP
jgi:hypothetical protein